MGTFAEQIPRLVFDGPGMGNMGGLNWRPEGHEDHMLTSHLPKTNNGWDIRHSDGGPEEVEEVRPRIDKDTVFRRYQLLPPQAQQDQRAVVLPVIRPKTLIPHHNNSPPPQDLWPARSRPHLLGFTDQDFDFPDQQPERLHRDRTRQLVESRVGQPVTVVVLGYGFRACECERRPAPGRPGAP